MKNSLVLLLTAFIWGVAFVAQSVGGDAVGCFTFNGVRSLIGAAVLLPVIAFLDKQKKKELGEDQFLAQKGDKKTLILGGISCGLMLCIASNFQQFGISFTTVGKAGFITAMYILIVPILGLFMKKKVGMKVWLGVILATVGLYMLCMTSESFSLSKGDLLVLVCAGFFSLHILIIDYFSPKVDGVRLSCIQFFVCGLISTVIAFIFENPNVGAILSGWLPILYAGVMSCGVAYTLQIIGQKNMDPTVASLILSLESVFSVLAGWVLLNQKLSMRELFGCVLMFLAIILAQLPERTKSL
ncbi:MAG: DMT family transporter [Lachnospiraceae bacterium]|nr:DMT family transporter [Lachnospiraceae bacterium]MBR5583419.1 DMT family transporter [Lachnospiraceae bacterium]